MDGDLFNLMKTRLDQSFSEPWGVHETLTPKLENVAETPEGSGFTASLVFEKATRTAPSVQVAAYDIGPITSETDVADTLADVLSRLLADHQQWPR